MGEKIKKTGFANKEITTFNNLDYKLLFSFEHENRINKKRKKIIDLEK